MATFAAIGPPGLGWQELVIVLVIALLFFGGRKLPELGSSIGKTISNFKKGMTEANAEPTSRTPRRPRSRQRPSRTPDPPPPRGRPPAAAMTTTAKPPASPQEYVGEEMTLVEHLQELRSRLFKSALAVAVAFVVGFVLYQPVFDILKKPYCQLPEELRPASELFDADRCVLVFNDVLGGFSIAVRAALVVTVIFAGPILFYQLFKFVVPGLRPIEKRFAVPFFVLSQALFAAGAVFAYFIIPRGLEFLLGFQPDAIPLLSAPQYLSFLINTMIAFGVSFEFPLILAILVLMGVIGTAEPGEVPAPRLLRHVRPGGRDHPDAGPADDADHGGAADRLLRAGDRLLARRRTGPRTPRRRGASPRRLSAHADSAADPVSADPVDAFAAQLPFALDDFQRQGMAALAAGHSTLVAAPTGAGKTLVGEFAIWWALQRGGKCFYTTPDQGAVQPEVPRPHPGLRRRPRRAADRRPQRRRRGAGGGDDHRGPAQHALRALADAARDCTPWCSTRCTTWATASAGRSGRRSSSRLPARRAAGVPLGDGLQRRGVRRLAGRGARWPRGPGPLRGGDHRPPPRAAGARLRDRRPPPAHVRQGQEPQPRDRGPGAQRHPAAAGLQPRPRPVATGPRLRPPRRSELVRELAAARWLPAICFVFSRQGCDAAVGQLVADGVRLTTPDERDEIRRRVEERVADLPAEDLATLRYAPWAAALAEGIAAHHAGMVPLFREIVEELFVANLVKVCFATETLALGINMPARTVVIERLEKWNGTAHELLTPGQFTQLTGRAGRRGLDPLGHAVVAWQRDLDFRTVAGLVASRIEPLVSRFSPSYNMAVNLLRTHTREQVDELLASSFAQFQADRRSGGDRDRLERSVRELDGLTGRLHSSRGDFGELWALRRELSQLESEGARDRKARRAVAVEEALGALQPGDVIALPPAGRRARLAAVVGRSVSKAGAPLVDVVTDDRESRRLGPRDLDRPPEHVGRIALPQGHPRQPAYRRGVQRALEGLEPRSGRDAPAVGTDPAKAARIAELRAAIAAHPVSADPQLPELEELARRADELRRAADQLERGVRRRTRSLVDALDKIVGLLTELGYLDETPRPTADGLVLAGLYGETDLVLAEALRDGVLDDLVRARSWPRS